MLTTLALIVSGHGIAGLLLWIIGVALAFAIVFWILRVVNAPAILFTALYVVMGLVALLLVLDFFFGATGDGAVIVR
jgi:predicted membrane channel-forming protein YqfA (hemolysin III family)